MSKVLVIGCGGVAGVAISKCCQVSEVFTELCIASRTKSKCDALAAKLAPITKTKITTAQVDADDVQQLCDLIQSYKPDRVMNIALPYQDLTIMDACLACGVNYMDTANYEPENTDDPEWRAIYEKRCKEAGFSAYFDYSWQWAYKKKFEEAGLTALLGCGFDPGVTQAYCAYAKKHEERNHRRNRRHRICRRCNQTHAAFRRTISSFAAAFCEYNFPCASAQTGAGRATDPWRRTARPTRTPCGSQKTYARSAF